MPFQSRFSSQNKHFIIDHEKIKIEPVQKIKEENRVKLPTKRRGGPKIIRKKDLEKKLIEIKEQSRSNPIFSEGIIFYSIGFTNTFNNEKISNIIEELKKISSIINYFSPNFIKISLKPDNYTTFCTLLRNNRRQITNLQETYPKDIVNLNSSYDDAKNKRTSIQMISLDGFYDTNNITRKLIEYVEEKECMIKFNYISKNILLFSGYLTKEIIQDIAKYNGYVENIEIIPEFTLESVKSEFRYSPLNSNKIDTTNLPIISVLDTGIDIKNELIKNNILYICNYNGNSNNSSDEDGHGTAVIGITIYGGDCNKNKTPKSSVISIKGFKDIETPLDDIWHLLRNH